MFAGAAPTALAFVAIRGPSPSGLGSRLAGRPYGPRRLMEQDDGGSIKEQSLAEAVFHPLDRPNRNMRAVERSP